MTGPATFPGFAPHGHPNSHLTGEQRLALYTRQLDAADQAYRDWKHNRAAALIAAAETTPTRLVDDAAEAQVRRAA